MKQLSELSKHPDNPRTYSAKEVRKIAKSISDFPAMLEVRGIVTNKAGVILGGHIRYEALLSLGYTEVPDEWVRVLDSEQEQRFIVTDNVPYGEWEIEQLAEQYSKEELKGWGAELNWNDVPGWKTDAQPKPKQNVKNMMMDYSFDDYMELRRILAALQKAGIEISLCQILHDELKKAVG